MVAHAIPDGYTMLMGTNSVPVNPFLFPGLTFDPLTDFAPVSLIGTYPNLMVVPVDSPAKTLEDFIARAKREKVTYASPGVGSSPHLAAELFKHMAKIDMTHVPYRGVAAGAMNDLLAGRLDAMFNTTGSLLQSVRAGQVRALAISSSRLSRNPACRVTPCSRGTECSCRPRRRPSSFRRCTPTSPQRSPIPPCKRASSRSA
jgi:tripartite-type tricarboxylate transporter receptor subunit TctC